MSGEQLRRAAHNALVRFTDRQPPDADIERLTLDVQIGEQHELVSLRLEGGHVQWACTCGVAHCGHAHAALSALASAGPLEGLRAGESEPPVSLEARVAGASDRPDHADHVALAEALDDLVTAVVRAGIAAGDAASVRAGIEHLLEVAPEPLPLGMSRWIGRLEGAVSARDVDGVARMLDGAARLADDLRAKRPSSEARERTASWIGALAYDTDAVYQTSDRTMIEVGREYLDGVERGAVERRYLLDLDSGDVYRDERARGRPVASLGTCPRIIHVGLAEVERAAEPRRIRMLQYVSVPVVTSGHWGTMLNWAVRRFDHVADRYRDAITAFPGLSEPFVVVAPDSILTGQAASLLDDNGRSLPLCAGQEPAALRYLEEQVGDETPTWVAGRLVDEDGAIMLRPVSMGCTRAGHVEHVRL